MNLQLTVHDNFFKELAQRLWKSSSEVVRELVQNSFDADASKVIVTFLPNGLAVEDDGGMDERRLASFLQVGGSHESEEFTPRGRRVVGKYRVGRLSALGSFSRMKVRTRLGKYYASFEFATEDLERLARGTVNVKDTGRPSLKRNGTEILLSRPVVDTKFEEVRLNLMQQPILRTPGFEVYIKQAEEFKEWDLRSAERLLPRDIPGKKLVVEFNEPIRVRGMVTVAADSALPLAEEDRGIGIVTSSHLVSRSLFGFESSPYRFDRVTGYVECDALQTTFGSKDRLVEDERYRQFYDLVHEFLGKRVVPALKDAELRHVGKLEVKTLRKVDRLLGEALAKVAVDMLPEKPVPPEALKTLVPSVIAQNKESTIVLVREDGIQETMPETQLASDTQILAPAIKQASAEVANEEEKPGRSKVGHYLHDVGIAVFLYDDEKDERPSYHDDKFSLEGVEMKAVFINKAHSSYEKCEKSATLLNHLITLISHELVAMKHQESAPIVDLINKLYGAAIS